MGAMGIVAWAAGIRSPGGGAGDAGATGLAPLTACAVVVLGLAQANLASARPRARRATLAATAVVTVVALATLLEHVVGGSFSPERWLLSAFAGLAPAGLGVRASRPLSDLLLVVLGAAVLAAERGRGRRVAGPAGTLVATVGLVTSLGYAYGAPLELAGAQLAVSLPAALGFLSLGAGLAAHAGPDALPLRWFAGPSTSALLRRWFLPVTVTSVLAVDLITRLLLGRLNPALGSALAAVVVAGCTAAVVLAVSRAVGAPLDRAAAALSASETRYRTTLDGMLEGCQIIAPDWRYLYVNDAAARHGRTTGQALVGRAMTEAYPGIDGTPMFAALRATMERRTASRFENEFVYPDGAHAWFDLSFEPVTEGVFVLSLDITDRKRAEDAARETAAKLQAALGSMTDAVCISDAEGRFIDFNDAFASFHRFGSKAECARTLAEYPAFLEVFLPDGTPAPLELWAVPLALRGETASRAEYTLRRKDTGETWVGSYSFAPIRDPHGAIVGSVVAGRDITDRKRAEEEIRQLNASLERRVDERTAELRAVNAELEAFTYSVSHDLRAPLRQADGFSKILLDEYGPRLDDTGRHYLDRVREGTRFMGALVDDLLNLSRVGRRELAVEAADLGAIVRTAIADLHEATQGRRIEWTIGPLPRAACDPGLIRLVFVNLLSNAVKFTGPREVATIEVGQMPVEGRAAVFVRDNGVGFDPKYTGKLFGIFQRLHRQEEFEGTGVGLATVQRIVHKHGGRVWAEGHLERGATFYFTLGSGGGGV